MKRDLVRQIFEDNPAVLFTVEDIAGLLSIDNPNDVRVAISQLKDQKRVKSYLNLQQVQDETDNLKRWGLHGASKIFKR